MDLSSGISDADKVLWYKIKRNGNFRKRKRDLVRNILKEAPLNESDIKDPDPHMKNYIDTGYTEYNNATIDPHRPANDNEVAEENHKLDISEEEVDLDSIKADP